MTSESPTVSVVIPCRNERGHVEACVRSMLDQEPCDGGLEVIVADGMSNDGTREILARLARGDHRLVVVDNPKQMTPMGMNAGIAVARGRYIAIAGAHNRYAADYLRQSVRVLGETGADNVGGAVICEAQTRIQRAVGAAHHSWFGGGGARWHDPAYNGPADTVFGGVYRREVFDRIGLFDEELIRNQDDELNLRLTRSGGTVWQSSLVRSWYSPRKTLRAVFQQYFQYGYWKVRVIQKHRLPASIRHLVPAAFVLAFVASLLLMPLSRTAMWFWLALAGSYAVCSLAAGFQVARRIGWDLFPMMPAVFACYHFGYGMGFLVGLRDFVITRRGPAKFSGRMTRTT